jgi:hypothetical protein
VLPDAGYFALGRRAATSGSGRRDAKWVDLAARLPTRTVGARPVVGGDHRAWGSAGPTPGVAALPGARVYGKYMEGVSGVGGGWIGRAMPVVIKQPWCSRGSGWGRLCIVVPGTLISVAEVLLPAVLGSCTCLYVAVRGFSGGGAMAHVHMVYSVSVESVV